MTFGINIFNQRSISIRPAKMVDKEKTYQWLAHSNLTSEMLGPPNFSEITIPTYEEFIEDYVEHYFEEINSKKGQCFIIQLENEEIGQINYNEITNNPISTEIDIWLADKKYTGKGYGVIAIQLLSEHLKKFFNCESLYIAPSIRNISAIKAYSKAGFMKTKKIPKWFDPDYTDSYLMVKKLK